MELTKTKYKQTEVGLIPEDWKLGELNQVCVFENGDRGINYPSKSDFKSWGKLFVNAGHLKNKSISLKTMDYVSDEKFHQLNGGKFKKNDILFCLRGSLGKFAIVNNEEQGAIASSLIIIRPILKELSTNYLEFYLESRVCENMIEVLAGGAAQPNLSGSELGLFKIPLPQNLTEQKAIATALSDVDDLIANLDKLITKKKAIKQGAMQQLLTPPHKGGKRLAGYTGEWLETILGNVCEIKKGQLITESTRIDGPIPVIAGGKKAAYYHANANRLGKTITISGSGANAGYVAFHNYPIFASDCSTIEESPKYSIEYIYYLLSLMQKQIYNAQTGGAQPHIHPSDLNPMEVDIPNIEEQMAISRILYDMEKEIDQLETKKAKYQDIKQGMMQELLTGKTRLV